MAVILIAVGTIYFLNRGSGFYQETPSGDLRGPDFINGTYFNVTLTSLIPGQDSSFQIMNSNLFLMDLRAPNGTVGRMDFKYVAWHDGHAVGHDIIEGYDLSVKLAGGDDALGAGDTFGLLSTDGPLAKGEWMVILWFYPMMEYAATLTVTVV